MKSGNGNMAGIYNFAQSKIMVLLMSVRSLSEVIVGFTWSLRSVAPS
jgi:hypothetical protein